MKYTFEGSHNLHIDSTHYVKEFHSLVAIKSHLRLQKGQTLQYGMYCLHVVLIVY